MWLVQKIIFSNSKIRDKKIEIYMCCALVPDDGHERRSAGQDYRQGRG